MWRYVALMREMWLLISTEPGRCISCCPPSRCGDGLIKYQFLMRDAQTLSEFIPEPFDRMFRTRAEIYAREKKAMARDWQEWKAKRKKVREKRRKKRQAEK